MLPALIFTARGSMPSKLAAHPRSSRMAARRTNFTSKSDLASEGGVIHDEVSTMSSADDAPTHSAPSPTLTPSAPSSNSLESAEKKSLAQIMATYGSPNSSSNPGVWGNGGNIPTTPPLPSQARKSNSHAFMNTNAKMLQHLSSRTKSPIHLHYHIQRQGFHYHLDGLGPQLRSLKRSSSS